MVTKHQQHLYKITSLRFTGHMHALQIVFQFTSMKMYKTTNVCNEKHQYDFFDMMMYIQISTSNHFQW